MNTHPDGEDTTLSDAESAADAVAADHESDGDAVESSPPAEKPSSFIKAMYHWVLSRL